jgi:hypothetical protein
MSLDRTGMLIPSLPDTNTNQLKTCIRFFFFFFHLTHTKHLFRVNSFSKKDLTTCPIIGSDKVRASRNPSEYTNHSLTVWETQNITHRNLQVYHLYIVLIKVNIRLNYIYIKIWSTQNILGGLLHC